MDGRPFSGLRTWIWTAAAPASAASRQEAAICSGVMGRFSLEPGSVRLPVTAQVRIRFRIIVLSRLISMVRGRLFAPSSSAGDRFEFEEFFQTDFAPLAAIAGLLVSAERSGSIKH